MTDSTRTDISMLLDRSGSMQAIKDDTIGGFDAFIAEQRKATGHCTVTLAQFDTDYDEVYTGKAVADVPSLVLEPRGMTALLDAIGRLVYTTGTRLAALPEDERPRTVIIGILTDGMENASSEFTHPAIKALITEQTDTFGWTFLYMGANQDAIEEGAKLGVAPGQSMTYAAGNVGSAFASTAHNVAAMRGAVAAGASPSAARSTHSYTDTQRSAATAQPPLLGRVWRRKR